MNSTYNCLKNPPRTIQAYHQLNEIGNSQSSQALVGRSYTPDQQCQLIYGSFSHYCNGVRL